SMLMRQILPLILISFLSITANAAEVTGTIKNNKGDVLPFASVLVKKTTIGTTANIKGEFNIQLSPGSYILICQYVGYKSFEQTIKVTNETLKLDIVLEEQQYDLKEVEVRSGGEDPAYAIIRNA